MSIYLKTFLVLCLYVGCILSANKTILEKLSSIDKSPVIGTLVNSLTERPIVFLDNIYCDAHEEIVATDPVYHKYRPYYVKLLRCQGADYSHLPTHRSCQPVSKYAEQVQIYVTAYATYEVLTMHNHTKCEYVCKENSTSCTKYQIWDNDNCVCKCDISARDACVSPKEWNDFRCCSCSVTDENKCKDRGLVIHPDTCECTLHVNRTSVINETQVIDVHHVIIAALVEFIIVVVFCSIIFYSFCYKKQNRNIPQVIKVENNRISMQVMNDEVKDNFLSP